jgi:hypothetical protein
MLIHEPIATGAEQDIFVTRIRQDNQSIAKTVRAQNKDFPVILGMGENVFSAPRTEIWANYFVRKRQFKMTERITEKELWTDCLNFNNQAIGVRSATNSIVKKLLTLHYLFL